MINIQEVLETNKMIEQENLDVRTIRIHTVQKADSKGNRADIKVFFGYHFVGFHNLK